MNKNILYTSIGVIILASIGVGLFFLFSDNNNVTTSQQQNQSNNSTNNSSKTFTKSELAKFNGKNGALCYVAVDGTVYEIKNSSLWENGEHTESNGQAMCGLDLSLIIKLAPHGKSILTTSKKVSVVGKLT